MKKSYTPAHLQQVDWKHDFTLFSGGLDTETAKFLAKPGYLRSSQNVYQDLMGGYRVTTGYERYSGKTKPADATYSILYCTLTGTVALNDVVTDDTAAAYGTIIAVAETYLVITAITGVFAVGVIRVSGIDVGECLFPQATNGAPTKKLNAQYKNLSADHYRAQIEGIPGSGDVLGIWSYGGVEYGFRNNAAGTATDMYKSTSSGWSLVALGRELSFTSGGTYDIQEGDTITGETSNATAVVTRVVLETGTFAAGTAAGRIILASQTGTFVSETLKVGATLNVATISGNSAAISFSVPSGKFEFVNANFTGSADTQRMYGVDGKNRAFEFDGTVFSPIYSGMPSAPTHIIEHQLQLFMSFRGSIQHSQPGYPYQYTLVLGSDELGMGDVVTGFVSVPSSEDSSTLGVLTRNAIGILYGSSTNTWRLLMYKRGIGAIEWSAQVVGNAHMLDDRGITQLSTAQTFGNFADGTSSKLFASWLRIKKMLVTTSCVSLEKNLYMLFFSDNTALYCTVDGGKIKAACPMSFNHKVSCICSFEDSSGRESIIFGSSNGMVYEMFKGTSFDGGNIEWAADLVYDHLSTPSYEKRFKRTTVEVSCSGYAEFFYGYSLGYDSPNIQQPAQQGLEVSATSKQWDDPSVFWDSFEIWDGSELIPPEFSCEGRATNIGHSLKGLSDYHDSIKFNGILLQYKVTKEA